jgi:hypothetical protein
VDTRSSQPIQGGTFQNFAVQGDQGDCNGIPPSAAAYSLNVTVVPRGPLNYLTVWPAGQDQPVVSTMNSYDGRVKANAAVVGAGSVGGGAVSVYATDTTDVILDLNGYFAPATGTTLAFYPLTPCRVLDTRNGQYLHGGQQYAYPVTGICNIPSSAAAYSLNFTAVPHGPLGYLTAWPAGQDQPLASILNAPTGTVTANAATIQAGTDMSGNNIDVYAFNDTDLLIDVNGYFAPAISAPGGLSLFPLTPVRCLDTRSTIGAFSGTLPVNVVGSPCGSVNGLPSLAQSLVVNATAVPVGPFGYLSLWANGQSQPVVSTLNAYDGSVTSNMAVVPTTNGFVNAFASDPTNLLVDIFDYFAIPSGLNGSYTFTLTGYNTPGNPPPSPCQNGADVGPFVMAGSFVADGNGHLSGVLDANCSNLGAIQPLNVSFTGSYSIQPNGLGSITITPTMNAPLHLSVAIASTANGRLVLQNESTSYLPHAWGTGAINVQNPADLSLAALVGNYASGFSGVDPSLGRLAGAGAYQIVQNVGNSYQLLSSGEANVNDAGTITGQNTSGGTLQQTPFDPTTGRGAASLIINGITTHWIYYATSANDLTFLSSDPITSPANLVLQTMRRQSTSMFDKTYLNAAGVVATSGLTQTARRNQQRQRLGSSGTTDAVVGLFTADGAGNASVSLDENKGGILGRDTANGTYSVDPTGLVTLTGFGSGAPILYLVDKNEGFVLGQDSSVAFGYLAPQSGSPFSSASAIGTYWGGNYLPATMDVTDSVVWSFADGMGNLNGTINYSGPGGTGSKNFTNTYSVDSTGRMMLFNGQNNLVDILYVISPTRVAMLPAAATDTDPSFSVFGSTN